METIFPLFFHGVYIITSTTKNQLMRVIDKNFSPAFSPPDVLYNFSEKC